MSETPDKPKSHGRLQISASLKPRVLMEEPLLLKGAWVAKIVTLFPDAFPGALGLSLTGKALEMGRWRLEAIDLRGFGLGKHRNVDDTPAGGGAGMVLRADVVDAALRVAADGTPRDRARWPVVYLSPRGKSFDQATARAWAAADGITLLCGRICGTSGGGNAPGHSSGTSCAPRGAAPTRARRARGGVSAVRLKQIRLPPRTARHEARPSGRGAGLGGADVGGVVMAKGAGGLRVADLAQIVLHGAQIGQKQV